MKFTAVSAVIVATVFAESGYGYGKEYIQASIETKEPTGSYGTVETQAPEQPTVTYQEPVSTKAPVVPTTTECDEAVETTVAPVVITTLCKEESVSPATPTVEPTAGQYEQGAGQYEKGAGEYEPTPIETAAPIEPTPSPELPGYGPEESALPEFSDAKTAGMSIFGAILLALAF